MRVAVISDTHGNAFALRAVLADIRATAPDLMLNLGDQVYGKADPRTAYELQAELGAVEVHGNTEEILSGSGELRDWLRAQLPAEAGCLPQTPLTQTAAEG
ncbi:metallophosphoesterase family protein [Deinococcus proteolyticus]|uniref:metallophosphoesterase family protein n=1 Tax=Deinococcus proteolyticus TaxID=55148 RepID=UPI00031889F0|nr:metallophosphoesterase [Deinococcus proteolyticus]